MKKGTLISLALALLALIAAVPPSTAAPPPTTYTVLLAGGEEANAIHIWLTPDGRSYVIDSAVQLEVGGSVCSHPEGMPNELVCSAPAIGAFEVNVGGGDDWVWVARNITVPVTLRGGAGNDVLLGGAGADKLLGGPGNDRLVGGRGPDLLYGGPGDDSLLGGPGSDLLRGGPGPGTDILGGGPGDNDVKQYR